MLPDIFLLLPIEVFLLNLLRFVVMNVVSTFFRGFKRLYVSKSLSCFHTPIAFLSIIHPFSLQLLGWMDRCTKLKDCQKNVFNVIYLIYMLSLYSSVSFLILCSFPCSLFTLNIIWFGISQHPVYFMVLVCANV